MANTKISDLGGREIAISGLPEVRIPCFGDGTSKPGDAVYYVDATGYATYATTALFTGFLDNDYKTAEDTAIPSGSPSSIIVPTSGHKYRIGFTDQNAGKVTSTNCVLVNGTGKFTTAADIALHTPCHLSRPVADNDTVAEVMWN